MELAVASGAEAIITYIVKDLKSAELIFKHKNVTLENFIEDVTHRVSAIKCKIIVLAKVVLYIMQFNH